MKILRRGWSQPTTKVGESMPEEQSSILRTQIQFYERASYCGEAGGFRRNGHSARGYNG